MRTRTGRGKVPGWMRWLRLRVRWLSAVWGRRILCFSIYPITSFVLWVGRMRSTELTGRIHSCRKELRVARQTKIPHGLHTLAFCPGLYFFFMYKKRPLFRLRLKFFLACYCGGRNPLSINQCWDASGRLAMKCFSIHKRQNRQSTSLSPAMEFFLIISVDVSWVALRFTVGVYIQY